MDPGEGGSHPRLWSAIIDHWLSNRMNPAQMKLACYLLRQGYVGARVLPYEEWRKLATRFEISDVWLRQSIRDLWGLGLLRRDRRGQRPGYSVNPDWSAPPPESPA